MTAVADIRQRIIRAPYGSFALLDAVEALCDAEDGGYMTFAEAEELLDQKERCSETV